MAEPITPHSPDGDFDELVRKMILNFEGSKIGVPQIIDGVADGVWPS
ncbi:MAG: hypothetical protein JXA41_11770 [Deltaproteobacteria bacterium]|nr:hypothetical protein [Deltaproteobacteria bacterium]